MVEPVSIRAAMPQPLRNAPRANNPAAPQEVTPPKLAQLAADLTQQDAPIDTAKIAKIRGAIASGNYIIDPQRIAQAMIRLDSGYEG